ncbi:MAG: OmpH family outer membrane protein [Selenomonadaceae bacterium]|nr:OmpH family outer membrane protein [Selenomonadaceae bacterium]MBR3722582.1 OmpH family outer membrane protein [Selenomonadaceae bacterium]
MKKKLLKFLAMGIFASLLLTGCGSVKVGIINEKKLVEEAPQIKTTMEEGNAKMKEVQDELQKKMNENPNMTEEEAMKIQSEAQRKAMGYNQQYMTQIQQKLNVALESISKEKDIDVVMNNTDFQKSVFMGGIDITDDVIKKLQ